MVKIHSIRDGVPMNVTISDRTADGHLRQDIRARFGIRCHILDQLGRDEHLHHLRLAAALNGQQLDVIVHAVRLTPDAEISATLPHGDDDIWAAYYTNLVGPGATRASWDALDLSSLYAVLLSGPDAYSTESWSETLADAAANGHAVPATLQRCNDTLIGEPHAGQPKTPNTVGSHAHLLYVTLRLSPVTPGTTTSPAAQLHTDGIHRFHRRCGFGQAELVEENTQEPNVFNYWQKTDPSPPSLLKVFAYGSIGKKGCRDVHWEPEAVWARQVLHSANLQTEWSELPDSVIHKADGTLDYRAHPARRAAARLAAVARMPYANWAAVPHAH
eukprot:2126064-Prymnesium_polylepis.1